MPGLALEFHYLPGLSNSEVGHFRWALPSLCGHTRRSQCSESNSMSSTVGAGESRTHITGLAFLPFIPRRYGSGTCFLRKTHLLTFLHSDHQLETCGPYVGYRQVFFDQKFFNNCNRCQHQRSLAFPENSGTLASFCMATMAGAS